MVNDPIALLEKAARAGGEVLMRYYRNDDLPIQEKTSKHDIVTFADTEVQKAIISVLKQEAGNHGLETYGFIGEEGVETEGEYRFVIDPIDGTSNFASNISYFCVSIALMKGNSSIAGVVYDVVRDEMYTAEQGKGAHKNGKKIQFKSGIPLEESAVVVTLSSRSERRKQGLTFLETFFPYVRTIRLFGAIALDLSRMADGEANIAVNFSCRIWDIAACVLIFKEAGGEVVDQNGSTLEFDLSDAKKNYSIVASDTNHIQKIILIYQELGI